MKTKQMKKNKCPFCEDQIENDGTQTWNRGVFWIKENIKPYKGNEGKHFMLIPKRHIKYLTEMTKRERDEFMVMIQWVTSKMLFDEGSVLFLLRQDTEGQSQEHLHLHFMVKDSSWTGEIPRGEYIKSDISLAYNNV